eukprot:4725710-Amphidinium_carterae.2
MHGHGSGDSALTRSMLRYVLAQYVTWVRVAGFAVLAQYAITHETGNSDPQYWYNTSHTVQQFVHPFLTLVPRIAFYH